MHIIITIFILLVSIGMFVGIAYGFFKTQKKTSSIFDDNYISNNNSNKKTYIFDINELTNDDYEDIDNDAASTINRIGEGANDTNHSYSMDGDLKREKVYVAAKNDDNGNIIVSIYKAYYKDFFHQENRYTVFIPLVYENIKLDDFNKWKNSTLNAPEYYFNSNKTSYTYGYNSLEEAINAVVKPLEKDYKVTSK